MTTPVPKVLVTGAAGFIGSHLVDRLLADGHAVVGVDDLSSGRLDNLEQAQRSRTFQFVKLDIVTPALRELVVASRPEVVIHLAAQMDVRKSVRDPLFDARTNVLGTVNVLEAAAVANSRKIIFASSGGTVYGQPEVLPVREDAPLAPSSPYGAAKVAGEVYLQTYQRLYGLQGTSLALGNVYGPRQDPHGEAGVVSIFAQALCAGEPTKIFGDGTSSRDYVYVDDVVDAFVRCLGPETSGKRYNVGTGCGVTVRELHSLLAGLCGAKDAPVMQEPRLGELEAIALDSFALAQATGWTPIAQLEHGLSDTVSWVRANSDQSGTGSGSDVGWVSRARS